MCQCETQFVSLDGAPHVEPETRAPPMSNRKCESRRRKYQMSAWRHKKLRLRNDVIRAPSRDLTSGNQLAASEWQVPRLGRASVYRKPTPTPPRLEAMLNERDHIRLQINRAENDGDADPLDIAELRRQLLGLDHEIMRHWESPSS